jgi:hypothetical protein
MTVPERSTSTFPSRLAWTVWGLIVVLLASGVWLLFVNGNGLADALWLLPVPLSFATVGALVAARHTRNAVGWLFLALGFYVAILVSAQEYARYALAPGHAWPGGEWAAWLGVWPVELGFPLLCLVVMLFPDGRFMSALWRWIGVAVLSISALGAAASALSSVNFTNNFPQAEHPLQLVDRDIARVVFERYQEISLLLLLASAVSLVVRLRRARGEERQQIKWFAYSSAAFIVAFFVLAMVSPDPGLAFALLAPLLPISAGLAIVKYRLYDIDHIINRTLVYGALTIALAGVYAAGVVGLGGVVDSITGQESNSLAVAASTLAVAALFGPARGRFQGFIDRRFYRRKYDAGQTLEAFSARLRDEVELEALTDDLLAVVKETVQPASASLWLKGQTS